MIYNYSFSPISDFIRSRGVVEHDDTRQLKHHLEFEYTPTIQEIRLRCSKIVDSAIKNRHIRVYLKNYSTFQSFLIHEFQTRGIRVYVPLFENMELDEELISYNSLNIIAYQIENGLSELANIPISIAEYTGNSNDEFTFRSQRSSITITLTETFIEEVRVNNIHHIMNYKYNIIITNMDKFQSDLRIHLNSEIYNTCMDLDSFEVSDFINYCNNKHDNIRTYDPKTVDDFETIIDKLEIIPDSKRPTMEILGTTRYNKLNIERNFEVLFNLPSLYRTLGFYYLLASEYHKSKIYLDKYLNMIDQSLYDEDVIFHPERNLIQILILLGQFDQAEIKALEMLENSNDVQSQFIHQNLAHIYRKTGRIDEAIEILNKLIENDSLDAKSIYHTQIANIYYKKGETGKAFEIIERLTNSHPIKFASTAIQHLIIYLDHYNKLPSLDTLRATKLTDSHIGQQPEFFETLDKYLVDNEYYADDLGEFLDMGRHDMINYSYFCFLILFKHYYKLEDYDRITEMMDRVGPLVRDEQRENIRLARTYLKSKRYEELYKLFDISIVDLI